MADRHLRAGSMMAHYCFQNERGTRRRC